MVHGRIKAKVRNESLTGEPKKGLSDKDDL